VRRTGHFEAAVSVSHNGLLLYQSGGGVELAELRFVDRAGKDGALVGKPADYTSPKLSHDGTRIAVSITDPGTQKQDIWVLDIARGSSTKLTFDPENDRSPIWSQDDRRIYFTSLRQGRGDIFVKSSFGTGSDEHVYSSPDQDLIWSLSPDGAFAWLIKNVGGRQGFDIFKLNLSDGKASVFLGTPFGEFMSTPSPDGRFLVYVSEESGRREVYVQSLSEDGGRWQISTSGGAYPSWTRGGREIVFQSLENKFVAVDVLLKPAFSAGVPHVLFDPKVRTGLPPKMWDVSADGERFLVARLLEAPDVEPLTLVQNWTATLGK